MRAISFLRKFCVPFAVILLAFVCLFTHVDKAQACASGQEAQLKIVARDHNGNLLKNIKWVFYLQGKDADGNPLLGKSLKSGSIGDTGFSLFSFSPDTYAEDESHPARFVLKFYETNAEVGEYLFWDKVYSCGESYTESPVLSDLKVILRDLDGSSLKNKKFELYEQKSDREGNLIVGDAVGKAFTTGDYGEKKIYVGPGSYILKVPSDVGTSYQRDDIEVNSAMETTLDYTLSNVSVVVRDGGGNLLPNTSFSVYKQDTNADGVRVLGTKMGGYSTGSTGQKSLYLPEGVYAFTFAGTGNNIIYLWNQSIGETESYNLNYRLATLSITARGFDNSLQSNIAVKIYKQTADADGNALLGDVVASGNTGENGIIKFYLPPARYAIELTGPDGQKNLYYNNDLAERGIMNLEKTLSALKVVLKDADGNLLKDVAVSLVEQQKDEAGNYLAGKVLKTKNTQNLGTTEFYFPPGKYALKIKGSTSEFYYFWDREIINDVASTVNLTLSMVRVIARDSEGKLIKNVAATLYKQDYDLSKTAILGSKLISVNTGEGGYADIRVPEGTYAIKAGNNTHFDLIVKDSYLTTINLITKDDIIKIDSVSDPRPAVTRPNNSLLRSSSTGKTYVLLNGQLHYISSMEIFSKYGYKWENVINVSQEELDGYEMGDDLGVSTGTIVDGSVVKTSDSPVVYLIESGKKRPFTSGQAFLGLGYAWSKIQIVSTASLANLEEGEPVDFMPTAKDVREGSVIKSSDNPAVYLIENGKKRPFTTGQAFESRGYKWNEILVLSPDVVDSYEEGLPLIYISNDEAVKEGSLVKSESSPVIYLISNNRKRAIANERIFLALGFEWESVLTVSQAKLDEYQSDLIIDFTAQDPDKDGLSNLQEEFYGTDPNNADSDGDGFLDGQEVNNGFNPLGPGRL